MARDPYELYTSTSSFFGDGNGRLTRWSQSYFRSRILHHLPSCKDAPILDLACGFGRYVKAMRACGYTNVIGIDISEEQVRYADEHLGLPNVVKGEAIDFLSTKVSEYDAILLMDILEHLNTDKLLELLRLVYQALRNNGVVVIHVPNALSPGSPHLYQDITHVRGFTVRSMTQCLLLSGFSQDKIEHCELPAHAFSVASRLRSIAWHAVFKPALTLFMLIMHGDRMGGIYTANLLTVARK